ncbi:MAG TPA: mandelate racemase/muconate lactonizing enzyme family protein [Acidimicrobiales bacterium]
MKITHVERKVLGTEWRNLTIVFVHTDEGLVGLGEARMINQTDALLGYLDEAVRNHVLGLDPFEIQRLIDRMWRIEYSRAGEIAMAALSVIEMACWDIMGKALDLPVYRLMGGPVRDTIKAYANGWYTVERTPEEFHAAARLVVAKGYRALKLDPFGTARYEPDQSELRTAIGLVEAVRDAIGPDAELYVEAHGRFTPKAAIQIARELAPYRPGWLEEPVPPENPSLLAEVTRATEVPIASGERVHTRLDFRELFERRAVDIVQPDITMCGGISETLHIAAWAEAYGMLVAPHNVGGPISTAAALQVAALVPNFKAQEHFNDFAESWIQDLIPGNPAVIDGFFALPTNPGLGVSVDPAALDEHPRKAVHFNLHAEQWHLRRALIDEPVEPSP